MSDKTATQWSIGVKNTKITACISALHSLIYSQISMGNSSTELERDVFANTDKILGSTELERDVNVSRYTANNDIILLTL